MTMTEVENGDHAHHNGHHRREETEEERRIRKEKELERKIAEDFGNSRIGRIRSFCWNMTEYPETGRAAQVIIDSRFSLFIPLNGCRSLH